MRWPTAARGGSGRCQPSASSPVLRPQSRQTDAWTTCCLNPNSHLSWSGQVPNCQSQLASGQLYAELDGHASGQPATLVKAIRRLEQRLSRRSDVCLRRPASAYLRENFYLTTSGNYHTPSLVGTLLELGADRSMFAPTTRSKSSRMGRSGWRGFRSATLTGRRSRAGMLGGCWGWGRTWLACAGSGPRGCGDVRVSGS